MTITLTRQETKDELLGFKATKTEAQTIKEICASEGISISNFIRDCINRRLENVTS